MSAYKCNLGLMLFIGCTTIASSSPRARQPGSEPFIKPEQVVFLAFGYCYPMEFPPSCETKYGTWYASLMYWQPKVEQACAFLRRSASIPAEFAIYCATLHTVICNDAQMRRLLKRWQDANIRVLETPHRRLKEPAYVSTEVVRPAILIGWRTDDGTVKKGFYVLNKKELEFLRKFCKEIINAWADDP